jgi:inhibitor of KinA sporulation pathway (predicted exonuclease)
MNRPGSNPKLKSSCRAVVKIVDRAPMESMDLNAVDYSLRKRDLNARG